MMDTSSLSFESFAGDLLLKSSLYLTRLGVCNSKGLGIICAILQSGYTKTNSEIRLRCHLCRRVCISVQRCQFLSNGGSQRGGSDLLSYI